MTNSKEASPSVEASQLQFQSENSSPDILIASLNQKIRELKQVLASQSELVSKVAELEQRLNNISPAPARPVATPEISKASTPINSQDHPTPATTTSRRKLLKGLSYAAA